jgi:predicted RNA methylase
MNEWVLAFIPFLLYFLYKIVSGQAIYIPLPRETVRKILKLAEVKKGELVYDLGSGDGGVVLLAAKEFGARAVGIEKNKLLVKISRWRVKRTGLERRVKILEKDFFDCNLAGADVIVVYLTQKMNDELKPKLEKELRRGTRVVSASHVFKGWKPVKRVKTGHFYSYLYRM